MGFIIPAMQQYLQNVYDTKRIPPQENARYGAKRIAEEIRPLQVGHRQVLRKKRYM